MSRFLTVFFRSGSLAVRNTACVLPLLLLLSSTPVVAHSSDQEPSASLQGFVHDTQGQPVPDASVFLKAGSAAPILIAHTDAQGTFHCSALRPGSYTLRVEVRGYSDATSGPFVLADKEAKKLDLTLELRKSPDAKAGEEPQFFDQPQFTIAGVTDATNLGGHGSGAMQRNSETLTRATVSLNKELPGRPSSPPPETENALRAAVKHNPADFEANHRLGNFLLQSGKAEEALPFFDAAARSKPADYENSYELAMAYEETGRYKEARAQAQDLLNQPNQSQSKTHKAAAHHLLAESEENLGKPLEAVRHYQSAAELNPTEPHLFDWGSELLLHHAAEPAAEVFNKGNHLFPSSTRMLIGLGVAAYARGAYDEAIQRVCEASDLNPNDPTPYIFLGKMQIAGTSPSPPAATRLADHLSTFVDLHPENAYASYYYAVTLIKHTKGANDTASVARAESLLQKAVHLDPTLGPAHLQLGILYAQREDFPNAISAYQKAILATPDLEEAHYRLAQAYKRTGETTKAEEEIKLYDHLSKKTAEELERRRHEIPQFVYTLRGPAPAPQ